MPLLEVKNLRACFRTRKGIVRAVNDVSFTLEEGKTLALVGESGSGKSVSAMSILRLLDENGYIEKAMEKVKPDSNAGEILEYLS